MEKNNNPAPSFFSMTANEDSGRRHALKRGRYVKSCTLAAISTQTRQIRP